MTKIRKSELKTLYKASDIKDIWNASQNLAVINHPQDGWISPNQYRVQNKGKPCFYCGQKMVHGKNCIVLLQEMKLLSEAMNTLIDGEIRLLIKLEVIFFISIMSL
jgi:hypothetical protein